ncbi:MAG: ABC transporter substrate-binding protein [Oscillospiraceae bacterium]|nr:ABC transporter substrate-binding protein [Oscillospiraceae bacterium]
MKLAKAIHKAVSLTLAGAMAFALGGCAGKQAEEGSALPEVVNIGTQQIPDAESLAIEKGFYEEALGVEVNILDFQAGDIRNAMISGDIDFAFLGSSSAVLGIASGMDAELIWIHDVIGRSEQLVAKNGSGIKTIQDLKGKKVATAFTSTAHYSLLRALALNGIAETEVTLLDMQMPDIYAAWQRGDIDAAYVWDPTLSKLLEDGSALVTSEELAQKGIVTANVELVRRDFAGKYPELVSKYLSAANKAVTFYREYPDEAAEAIAGRLNITPEEAKNQAGACIWLDAGEQLGGAYLGSSSQKGRLVESLTDIADFLYEQKSLPSRTDSAVFEKAVNPSYLEAAIK